MELKNKLKWYNRFFYMERGVTASKALYWDTLIISVFNFVIVDKTLECGILVNNKKVIKYRSKFYKMFTKKYEL